MFGVMGKLSRWFDVMGCQEIDLSNWSSENELDTYLYDRDARKSVYAERAAEEETLVFLANRSWDIPDVVTPLPSLQDQLAQIAVEYALERPLARILPFVPRQRLVQAVREVAVAA